jgi:hypothetical protein
LEKEKGEVLSDTLELKYSVNSEVPPSEKRWFFRVAQYFVADEHIYDIVPNKPLLDALRSDEVDLFSFIERSFLDSSSKKRRNLFSVQEGTGLLRITSYDNWLKSISSRARFVRKGFRLGLKVEVVNIDEQFLKSALNIYNETPFRQGRRYSGYGVSMKDLKAKFATMGDSEVLGAYYEENLIGLIWVGYGDRVAALRSFLSLISCRDKYPNNCLIAETVKRCVERGYQFLTYGNMGYNPGLDFFKQSNGFRIFNVPRYFVPLTTNGMLAVKLGLCQPLEHNFSPALTRALLPFYNRFGRYLPAVSAG